MSYDIYIGEARIAEYEDGDLYIRVDKVTREDAPHIPNDQMTGKGNSRYPGYSQWSKFCKESGLDELFFDEEVGLMRKHPGAFLIKQVHLETIRSCKELWINTHPNTTPGFPEEDIWRHNEKITNADPILARLVWLEFWFDWALKNCKTPTICNR